MHTRNGSNRQKNIANQIGDEEEQRANLTAFSGRIKKDENGNVRGFYSLPRADKWFKLELAKIYPKEGDAK